MSDLKFTDDHEWISVEGDIATVGITEHATTALGDLVYVELPEVGQDVESGGDMAVVGSPRNEMNVTFACCLMSSGRMNETW